MLKIIIKTEISQINTKSEDVTMLLTKYYELEWKELINVDHYKQSGKVLR